MMKSIARRSPASVNVSRTMSMIESLENRRMLSASPAISPSLVRLMPAASARIMAGKTGSETVTIRNPGDASETQLVTITLAPSADGTTACESYTTPSVTKSLTIRAHSSAHVKVPFVAPATLPAGKYHTLATVQVGDDTITAATPGTYTLALQPAITTSPNLVGDYSGVITGTSYSHGNLMLDQATFSWDTTQQTTSSLNGVFSVGTGQTAGTMNGSELNTGKIRFTLMSDNIKYVITGHVMHNGEMIKGSFRGKLADNVFPWVNGSFRIIRQAS